MVFPMEMYQKHFQGISSLRQGLRNFWADVTNQYGGFWDFKVGQDADKTNIIGVSDLNLSEPKQPARFENLSSKEDYYDLWTDLLQKYVKQNQVTGEIYSGDLVNLNSKKEMNLLDGLVVE